MAAGRVGHHRLREPAPGAHAAISLPRPLSCATRRNDQRVHDSDRARVAADAAHDPLSRRDAADRHRSRRRTAADRPGGLAALRHESVRLGVRSDPGVGAAGDECRDRGLGPDRGAGRALSGLRDRRAADPSARVDRRRDRVGLGRDPVARRLGGACGADVRCLRRGAHVRVLLRSGHASGPGRSPAAVLPGRAERDGGGAGGRQVPAPEDQRQDRRVERRRRRGDADPRRSAAADGDRREAGGGDRVGQRDDGRGGVDAPGGDGRRL